MWLGSLLTSSAASLGRLVVVGLIPNAVPAVFVVLLVEAHSFSGRSTWSDLPKDLRPDAPAIVLFVLAIALATVVVQPFQLRLLRVLEGYWDSWTITAKLAPFFVELQRRRREKLRRIVSAPPPEPESDLLDALVRHQRALARSDSRSRRASLRLARYPGQEPIDPGGDFTSKNLRDIPLLPTGLGNALRAGETSGGERYGLKTLGSWPRLYPFFPESFAKGQASVRDALDAAANLCVNFFITAVLGVIALHDEPAAYWIIAVSAALSCLSYVGAIAAASEYNMFIQTAYDLYRFELLKSARYPLPKDPYDELKTFTALSKLYSADLHSEGGAHALTARIMHSVPYDTGEEEKDTKIIAAIWRRLRRNP